jgi:PBP1b-binding outer membrane lipoprotein LpoB
MKIPSLILALTLFLTGCAAKTSVHPGATAIDSYAFDFLLVEQGAINAAKDGFAQGNLPTAAHDPLNAAIAQYDSANHIWQAFHQAGGVGDATALNDALAALKVAVDTLQAILGKPAVKTPARPMATTWRPHGYAYS